MSHFIFTLRKVSLWFKRQSEFHFSKSRCCRKADPFQGPKPGSCLTLRDELSEETRVHQARDFIGKGTLVENSKVREPRRTALPRGLQGFMVVGWSIRVFPSGAHIAQPRCMLVRGILGSGWTPAVSFRPFPNSSGWWWLISSVFLIRISCHKTTHANGYYGAWPGWAVSISVLPLTKGSRS